MRNALAILAPPPAVTISEWADAKRRLSSEASAEPGRWSTARAAYQRGIMDAIIVEGDTLEVDGTLYVVQGEPIRDADGLVRTLETYVP